jgi:hypothetical protein
LTLTVLCITVPSAPAPLAAARATKAPTFRIAKAGSAR